MYLVALLTQASDDIGTRGRAPPALFTVPLFSLGKSSQGPCERGLVLQTAFLAAASYFLCTNQHSISGSRRHMYPLMAPILGELYRPQPGLLLKAFLKNQSNFSLIGFR
ncbi:hypothetical protein OMCYN_01606 [cyanobiont of Ornithocercus magnificus]|nr:hypothetical protein OMCYN_01606 [cyanobiont of Ornithocercus magnificus]